jgi:Tfp pilus assembly PilM family ATPase
LLAQLTRILPGRMRKILALDWDDRTLKAIEATLQKDVLRVQRVISAAIPEGVKTGEAESFGPFIRQVLADKKFSTRQALLAIPRDKVILINLRLPTAPVGDLANMVKLQASRELPFSADEAVIDFAGSVARDAPEFTDVTVGAIQRDVLAQYRQLAAAAGLQLLRVGLRPNSNLLSITRGVQPFLDDRILFVDVGAQTTEINIFRWGRLTFSRSVSIALDAATSPESRGDEAVRHPLLMEVMRTVEAYRATDPNKLDQVVIAGDTGLETSLAEALHGRIAAPSSPYDPSWTVAIEKDRALQMTGFSAALGLLIGEVASDLTRFDFLVPKRQLDKVAIRRKQIIVAAAGVFVLLASIWLTSHSYISNLETRKAEISARIVGLKKQAESVDVVGKRVATAEKWMKQDMVWLDKLREIVQQMPDNQKSYMTKVTAKATSADTPDARELQMGLRMSDWRVPTDLQDSLRRSSRLAVKLGPSRQTSDPKYGFTGDVTIVIPPEKAKPGAKPGSAATRPAAMGPSDGAAVGTRPGDSSMPSDHDRGLPGASKATPTQPAEGQGQ